MERKEFRAYFSDSGTEAYVLTGPLPRLGLKDEPEPQDAPVYMDFETGEGCYPEGVSAQQAYHAAEYAREKASEDSDLHLRQDSEAWREEFSELFDMGDLGPSWSVNMDNRSPNDNRF